MKKLLLLFALPALAARPIAAQLPADLSGFLIPDRAAEVAMARSAAPARISDSATVLVLTRTGYVEAAHGTNGWTCVVIRNYQASMTDFTQWSMTEPRAPHCLNAIATRTVLPEMTARAGWVMSGLPAEQVVARIKAGFRTHRFRNAAAGAMAYMTSPQQRFPGGSAWKPHVMFYYPPSADVREFGGGDDNADVTSTTQDPMFGFIVLVPVQQWSDGTPYVAVAAEHQH